MLHFGMTGDLRYYKADEISPKAFALYITFTNGNSLAFVDPRRFGKIAIVKDISAFIIGRGYGKDALEISKEDFVSRLNKKRVAIKSALLDQHNVAGVGNEFADEILFASRIHPESLSNKLTHQQLGVIHRHMAKILKEAVSVNAKRDELEHYFFLGNRAAGLLCPNCGSKTELKTVGGRSSYYCPNCQVLHR